MAHTNSTTNYQLPQFLPTDKPAWLVDVNPAYAAIDTAIKNASDAAGNAQTDATQALSDAAGANAIATQANTKADGAIASLAEAFLDTATYAVGEYVIFNNILYVCTDPVTTPGPWTGSVNWTRASLDSIATELNNAIRNVNEKTGSDINISDTDNRSIETVFNNLINPTIRRLTWNNTNVTGDPQRNSIIILGKIVVFSIEFTPLNGKIAHNNIIATGLPIPNNNVGSVAARFVYDNKGRQLAIDENGNLIWYFPTVTNDYSRIDLTGVYVAL